jgi:S-adenosylmethionine decarboxylase
MFGPHLVLEGYNCKAKKKLGDRDAVYRLLEEFPSRLNMTTILPPQVMFYNGGDIPEDYGVSGFVIIAESHIAIHTFPEKGFFTLDIFSCKPFAVEAAINYVMAIFEADSYEHKVFERGREFPRCIGRSSQIVSTDRTKYVSGREFSIASSKSRD